VSESKAKIAGFSDGSVAQMAVKVFNQMRAGFVIQQVIGINVFDDFFANQFEINII
jgi:hypothetical protein